jgi:iron complex outermembrane receptor protein
MKGDSTDHTHMQHLELDSPLDGIVRLTLLLVLACLSPWVVPAHGQDGSIRSFDIPAGPAADTLKLFSAQSGSNLIAATDTVKGLRTVAVHGNYTPSAALSQMLGGSGLIAVRDAKSGSFTVRREGEIEKKAEGRTLQLEKYEVTDRRVDGLINKGLLQAGADAPLYHNVVDRAEIERLGATSMEELFRFLPQTTTGVTSSQNTVGNFGSGARFPTTSLRGFSASQTVILINGRALPRTQPTAGGGPDINRIPIAAIERIEVLPYSGSAIYGAGAIGGAINIILRKDYSGRDLTTYIGTSTNGGATEYRFTYVEGLTFNQGRTNLTLTVNYQHREPLRLGQRDYLGELARRYGPSSNARNLATGALAFETLTLPAYANAPATLVVGNLPTAAVNDLGIPGAPGLRFAVVPAGTTAAQSQLLTPGSFTTTAGQLSPNARYARMVIYEPIDSTSINAQVEHKLIPEKLEAYGEFTVGYNRREIDYPELLSVSLTATDPLNPFRTGVTPGFVGRPVTVLLDTPDLTDAGSLQEYQSARAVLGLKGKITSKWDWSVDGAIDYANSTSNANSPTNYLVSLSALTRPAAAAPVGTRRAVYPLLSDHRQFPLTAAEADKYFWFTFHAGNRSVVGEGNARVTGELFQLPAGALQTSVAAKFRTFDLKGSRILDGSTDAALLASGVPQSTGNLPIISKRSTLQTVGELVVPVISKSWRPIPVESLELNLSASHESNDTDGFNQSSQRAFDAASKASTMYVLAGKLQITRDIAFRGSFSEGFYPPDWGDVSDLVTPSNQATGLVPDPKRGNTVQTTPWTLLNGGNPNVQPEKAQSVNVGMILTPRFVPGLTLSVDYWSTEKDDAILRTNFVQVVSSPDDFAPYITRAAPTPADTAAGWLGVITEVRSGPINVSRLETDGFDVRAKLNRKTESLGEFIFDSNASFTNHFQTKATPTGAVIETAGAGGPIRWRGYASTTWLKSNFGATLTGRYVGHYSSNTTSRVAAFPTSSALDGGRIPAFLHWDVQFTYDIPYRQTERGWRNWVSATKWTLGVLNVLDEEPSIVSDVQSAFYNRQVDPRQRYVYVQVRKSL